MSETPNSTEKKVVIIAGPNRAGKTTFATEFLPHEAGCPTFINADLIANGLNPFRPDASAFRAGRIMLELMEEYTNRGESFSFETTLSGRTLARSIPRLRDLGSRVKLIYLRLESPDIAISRVRQRVSEGGHHVSDDVVRRRFHAGLCNLIDVYKPLVDEWIVYDNAGRTPVIIEEGGKA